MPQKAEAMTKKIDIINAAVELIAKAAILAARFSGKACKRSLKRLSKMDAGGRCRLLIPLESLSGDPDIVRVPFKAKEVSPEFPGYNRRRPRAHERIKNNARSKSGITLTPKDCFDGGFRDIVFFVIVSDFLFGGLSIRVLNSVGLDVSDPDIESVGASTIDTLKVRHAAFLTHLAGTSCKNRLFNELFRKHGKVRLFERSQ
jgi:hypothetical protein